MASDTTLSEINLLASRSQKALLRPEKARMYKWNHLARQIAMDIRNMEKMMKSESEKQRKMLGDEKDTSQDRETNPLMKKASTLLKELYYSWKRRRENRKRILSLNKIEKGRKMPMDMLGVCQESRKKGTPDDEREFHCCIGQGKDTLYVRRFKSEIAAWRYLHFEWEIQKAKLKQERHEITLKLRHQGKIKVQEVIQDQEDLGFERLILKDDQVLHVDSARLYSAKPLDFHREVYSTIDSNEHHQASSKLAEMMKEDTPRPRRIKKTIPPGVHLLEDNRAQETRIKTGTYRIINDRVKDEIGDKWRSILRKPAKLRTDEDVLFIASFVKQIPYFRKMQGADVKEICKNVTLQTLRKNECLYEQGALGCSMYIVTSGTIEMKIRRPSGFWYIACNLYPGEIFGEMAVSTPSSRRYSTVCATEKGTEVLCIESEVYRNLSIMCTIQKENQNMKKLFPVFSNVSNALEDSLTEISQERFFTRHSIIVKSGTRPDSMLFIKKGFCEILKEVDGKIVSIYQLGPGDYFGGLKFTNLRKNNKEGEEEEEEEEEEEDEDEEDRVSERKYEQEEANSKQEQKLSPELMKILDNHPKSKIEYSVVSVTEVAALEFENRSLAQTIGPSKVLKAILQTMEKYDRSNSEIKAVLKAQKQWKIYTKNILSDEKIKIENQKFGKNFKKLCGKFNSNHSKEAFKRWQVARSNPIKDPNIPKAEGALEVQKFLLKMSVLNGETPKRPTFQVKIPLDPRFKRAGAQMTVVSNTTNKEFQVEIPSGYGPGMELTVVDTTLDEEEAACGGVQKWFLDQKDVMKHKRPDFASAFSKSYQSGKTSKAKADLAAAGSAEKDDSLFKLINSSHHEGQSNVEGDRGAATGDFSHRSKQHGSSVEVPVDDVVYQLEEQEKTATRDDALGIIMHKYSIYYHEMRYHEASLCLDEARQEVQNWNADDSEAKQRRNRALNLIDTLSQNVRRKTGEYEISHEEHGDSNTPTAVESEKKVGMKKVAGVGRRRKEKGSLKTLLQRQHQRQKEYMKKKNMRKYTPFASQPSSKLSSSLGRAGKQIATAGVRK